MIDARPRSLLYPESSPTLPLSAGAKQDVLTKALMFRSPIDSLGLQVITTRDPMSSLPVNFDPMLVSPENCQPFNTIRPECLMRDCEVVRCRVRERSQIVDEGHIGLLTTWL